MMPKKEHLILHNNRENNPNFGKHHSEESKIKMSESHIGKHVGENNPINYEN